MNCLPETATQTQLRNNLEDLNRRLQDMEISNRNQCFDRISLELKEVQQVKEDIKLLLEKDKMESSISTVMEKVE